MLIVIYSVWPAKAWAIAMAENDIDLYADDIDQEFVQVKVIECLCIY